MIFEPPTYKSAHAGWCSLLGVGFCGAQRGDLGDVAPAVAAPTPVGVETQMRSSVNGVLGALPNKLDRLCDPRIQAVMYGATEGGCFQ